MDMVAKAALASKEDFNRADQTFGGNEYNWSIHCDNLWELLTAVLLDTRTPLERLNNVLIELKNRKLLNYISLHDVCLDSGYDKVATILKECGYPWYNQKARCFGQGIALDLATASYEDMQTIKGIGPKLASMWMRMVHGEERPIIDTHVKQWLAKRGHDVSQSYKSLSEIFIQEAAVLKMSVSELDHKIVAEGIARRRGLI